MNNNNMKKTLILIIAILLALFGSCKKNKTSIFFKTIKLNDTLEVKYESTENTVDELFEEELASYYNRSCDDLKAVKVKSFSDNEFISYYVRYHTTLKTTDFIYNYSLKTKKKIVFNEEEIIKEVNKNKENLSLKTTDASFLKYLIKDGKLVIFLSKYLTGEKNEQVVLPMEEKFIKTTNEVTKNKKMIALTFDDGPSVKTKEIVDLLDEEGVSTTFFILGTNALFFKDELKYIYDHNHEIGNHSYTHPNFKNISKDEGLDEIKRTSEVIYSIIKHYPRVFRFPYGAVNKEVLSELYLPVVLWDTDSLDWKDSSTEGIIKRVKKEAKENSIILFHDFKFYNAVALRTIIRYYKDLGYEFVKVSTLLDFTTDDKMILGKVFFNK